LGAFVIAVAAVVVSPGPDTMIILRYALASGRRAGFAAVAGVQLGLMVHTVLAVLGVSLIIASSPVLFKLVAVAGAAYLAWLGVLGFRGAAPFTPGGGRPSSDLARACRDGILTNLLNPKVILLFLALFPNFVDAGRDDVPAQLATLAVVLIVVNVIWQAPLAWAAEAIGRWLGRPGVGLWVSRITGGVLLAFAALLLYQHLL
ncbi:MAG: LysE family translocator, partial [Proteobacteria bacterium]|nr:LysE family translocator [Pseudomonadota bacterium]